MRAFANSRGHGEEAGAITHRAYPRHSVGYAPLRLTLLCEPCDGLELYFSSNSTNSTGLLPTFSMPRASTAVVTKS